MWTRISPSNTYIVSSESDGRQWALLAAAHPETVAATLLPDDPPEDPAVRLGEVSGRSPS